MANTPAADQNKDINLDPVHETTPPHPDVTNPYLTPGRTRRSDLPPTTPPSTGRLGTAASASPQDTAPAIS